MSNTIAYVCFGIGAAFNLLGCLGLLRLPDVYNRLQAATKCVTFGTIFLMVGVLVWSGGTSMGIKALVCLVFILITSPTAAHAIARGAHHAGVRLWKKSVQDAYLEDRNLTERGDQAGGK
jgi:multicomponent Na+:H+ antiporter subunit G